MNYQTYLFFDGRAEYIQGYDTPQHTFPLGSLVFGLLDMEFAPYLEQATGLLDRFRGMDFPAGRTMAQSLAEPGTCAYHNAKVLVKAAAIGAEPDRMLMEGGRWSPARLRDAFQRDSLGDFSEPFRQAVLRARETLNAGNDPQRADFVLDRAYFQEMADTAKAVGSPFLQGYVRLLLDAANLRSAVRAARIGKGPDFLRQVLLPGGNVDVSVLSSGRGADLAAVFRAGPLGEAAAAGAALTSPGSGELTAFERMCDDAVMHYLEGARLIPFGEQSVIGYLYARESEFTAIRTILSGRMAGLDSDTIRERLREAYV